MERESTGAAGVVAVFEAGAEEKLEAGEEFDLVLEEVALAVREDVLPGVGGGVDGVEGAAAIEGREEIETGDGAAAFGFAGGAVAADPILTDGFEAEG